VSVRVAEKSHERSRQRLARRLRKGREEWVVVVDTARKHNVNEAYSDVTAMRAHFEYTGDRTDIVVFRKLETFLFLLELMNVLLYSREFTYITASKSCECCTIHLLVIAEQAHLALDKLLQNRDQTFRPWRCCRFLLVSPCFFPQKKGRSLTSVVR